MQSSGDQLDQFDQSHIMSEELDWELSDIFEGGMFAFPVYESSSARRVVRYLLRRGVLGEEVASAIEQPGSTADLVAWLAGDERKSMVGVWAMAWLNDARRRYDLTRHAPPPQAPPPQRPTPPLGDRQPSVDSDFGGSGDDSRTGSRKGSIGDGLSTDYSDHVTTDDEELSLAGASDICCRKRTYRRDVIRCIGRCDNVDHGPPSRPRSDLDLAGFVAAGVDVTDSGNVSDACTSVCGLDRKSGQISCGDICRCTLSHYTASADTLICSARRPAREEVSGYSQNGPDD